MVKKKEMGKKIFGALLILPAILFLCWMFFEAYRVDRTLFLFLILLTSIPMASFGIFLLTEKP